jgi:hypothetical protein
MVSSNLKSEDEIKKKDTTVIKVKPAVIKVMVAKNPLVTFKSALGKRVVKADVTRGRKAMKKAMEGYKKGRTSRRTVWPGIQRVVTKRY